MSRSSLAAVVLVAAGLGACAVANPAPSGLGGRSMRGGDGDFVVAESRYGHGSVSGPVRRGPRGYPEVRLPGGTWVDCARNCSETLRRETVDFWENHGGRNDPPDGPAYLRWKW